MFQPGLARLCPVPQPRATCVMPFMEKRMWQAGFFIAIFSMKFGLSSLLQALK